MTRNMYKFVELNSCDGGIVKVGNNAACYIKGIGSITLYRKTRIDDVYFVNGLKYNPLSVGYFIDNRY
jgi:hypothetical protein